MEKISGVYTITCAPTGRRYVGQSADVKARWRVHRSWLNTGKHPIVLLQQDWNRYGASAFEFRTVAIIRDRKLRLDAEQAALDAVEPEHRYNIATGVISSTGTKLTNEHKLAISMANRDHPKSASHRAKLSEAQQRHWATQERTPELSERMAAMARKRKGEPKSAETRRRMSEAQKGKTLSPEHLANLRAAKAQGGKPLKLDAERVREIKRRLAAGEPVASLAREFGVKPASVSDIKAGRSWRHVTIT